MMIRGNRRRFEKAPDFGAFFCACGQKIFYMAISLK